MLQGARPNKFAALHTLQDLEGLVDTEKKALARRAAKVVQGTGGAAPDQSDDVSMVMASSGVLKTPKKREGKKAGGADDVVEITGVSRKSKLDDINLAFIMWGHSQKPQIAGARTLDADACGIRDIR